MAQLRCRGHGEIWRRQMKMNPEHHHRRSCAVLVWMSQERGLVAITEWKTMRNTSEDLATEPS